MKNKIKGSKTLTFMFFGIPLMCILLLIGANIPIKKKSPITPTLLIETKNGVTDTTYIYKR